MRRRAAHDLALYPCRVAAPWWGALFLAACGPPPALEVGPVAYTTAELGALGSGQRERLVDLTAFGLAVADGRLPEVVAPFLERERRSLMLQRLALEVAVRDTRMDETELREAYTADPELELVVRHLVVLSERWRPQEHRDSARARAEEARARAAAGEDFARVVAEYSDEPGAAERAGLLDPGRRGSWVPEFWDAASSLEVGEISDVVETEYGFHVLRLDERRPVPFEEVRHEVLQRFVDLPSALGRAEAWAAAQAAALEPDTAAIAGWRGGAAHDTTLVRWPGGTFTGRELEDHLATLAPEMRDQVSASDAQSFVAFVRGAARNAFLVDRAEAMGLEPSESQRVVVERRWRTRVANWAETLGFGAGWRPGQVKRAALEALGTNRQEVLIVRRELALASAVLRELYPVRHARAAT